MTRSEEIASFWGDMLVKIPAEILDQSSFPKETDTFLKIVGLPLDARFNDLHPAFQFTPDDTQVVVFQGRRYIAVGSTSDRFLKQNHYHIALSENVAEVFLVPFADSIRQSVQFLNSDIQSLLLCLAVRLRFRPLLRELAEQEQLYRSTEMRQTLLQDERLQKLHLALGKQRQIIEEIQQTILCIDAKALDPNLDTFWQEQFAI